MPNIKSSTDLRNGYNAISAFCHKSREPVFITKNGKGDLAVMSIESYEDLTQHYKSNLDESRNELYHLLEESRADVEAGRTLPHREVIADLERRLADGTL